ncbi:hypothetical protein ABZZ79_35430 [Streptomyces sp. NPDC006458]|uniref:hypothetical protein n=1 Tax=Streptomyces sp. NPDC006458 TaxID=3154302 RepID=UPI0033A28816
MDPLRVLAAVAASWERLGPYLTDLSAEAGERLASALEEVRAADGPDAPRGPAETAARLVLDSLPPQESSRLEAGDGVRYADGTGNVSVDGFVAADLAVLLLDGSPMVGPVLGPVRTRLLAEPALEDAELRVRGGDPTSSGLIRLSGPGGRALLPSFQFRADALPWQVVLEVNTLLDAGRDPWGAADWWLSDNAWLRSVPAALLGAARDEELVGAARSLLEGD